MRNHWKMNLMTLVFYIAMHMPMDESMLALECTARIMIMGMYAFSFVMYAMDLE
jgi:hypothetical protein